MSALPAILGHGSKRGRIAMNETPLPTAVRTRRSIFLPLAMIAAALLGSLLSDIYQESRRYGVLVERNGQLDASMTDSRNVRRQFDVLVKGLVQLEESGNRNAATIMTRLRQSGVTVNSDSSG